MLDGLDDDQRAAATAPRGPVCVLAGAGTGKTRTITHRIAHLVRTGHVAPGQVLAVTFTARAAGEMRTRLRALGVAGRAGAHVPRRRAAPAALLLAAGRRRPAVAAGRGQAAHRRAGRGPGEDGHRRRHAARPGGRDRVGEGQPRRARGVPGRGGPAAPRRARRPPSRWPRSTRATRRPRTPPSCSTSTICCCTSRARSRSTPTSPQEFRDRYRCFVVDEYQDVTPLQQRVLDAWLGERDDLTVVGDANQTIYTFAGRQPEAPAGVPAAVPRGRRRAAAARLPLHPAGRRRGQHAHRRGPRPARGHPAAADRPAPGRARPGFHRARRRGRRGRRGRHPHPAD